MNQPTISSFRDGRPQLQASWPAGARNAKKENPSSYAADSAIDDGQSLNAEKIWHENRINTGGFSRVNHAFQ
jgi:hypothetical protein